MYIHPGTSTREPFGTLNTPGDCIYGVQCNYEISDPEKMLRFDLVVDWDEKIIA